MSIRLPGINLKVLVFVAIALAFGFVFFFGIETLKLSLFLLGEDFSRHILQSTSNHFVALFIGLLVTAMIQSSSTVTSLLVVGVSSGTMDFDTSLAMVMGANIGTTLTAMLISLGYVSHREEFKRAIEAALLHNIFNVSMVIILFPMEQMFGLLSRLSIFLTDYVYLGKESAHINFGGLMMFFRKLVYPLAEVIPYPSLLLALAIFMIFGSISLFTYLARNQFEESSIFVEKRLFGNDFSALVWGIFLTSTLQSSSVTTSMVVPLVATGRVSLKSAFPFILGANLGTTITALFASVNTSETAVALAICHVLFNLIGVVLYYPIKPMRKIPTAVAQILGGIAFKYRVLGFVYLLSVFFGVPFLLIYLSI